MNLMLNVNLINLTVSIYFDQKNREYFFLVNNRDEYIYTMHVLEVFFSVKHVLEV